MKTTLEKTAQSKAYLHQYNVHALLTTPWYLFGDINADATLADGTLVPGAVGLHYTIFNSEWMVSGKPDRVMFRNMLEDDEFGKLADTLLHVNYNGGTICHVDLLYVKEACRGNGFATTLMNNMLQTVKMMGCTQSALHVEPHGEAGLDLEQLQKFYGKFGYEPVGNTEYMLKQFGN